MAHIFDVMATVNGQLNILSKYYEEGGIIRNLPTVPYFVKVCAGRLMDDHKEEYLIDMEKPLFINNTVLADTGDDFNPVYLCVCENLKTAAIDRAPIIVNKSDKSGPGIAFILFVPLSLFTQDDINIASELLKGVYFKLLSLDSAMTYKPSASILRLANSSKIEISTYDVTMMLVALGCIFINLRSWYYTQGAQLSSEYVLSSFTEKELPKELRNRIITTLNNNATKIANLRDSISTGQLEFSMIYDED